MMKSNNSLDTTTVAEIAMTPLCDNPLHSKLPIPHPDMEDITFTDLKVLVMQYHWAHVKNSQFPDPPRGHVWAVQDLGDAFDMPTI